MQEADEHEAHVECRRAASLQEADELVLVDDAPLVLDDGGAQVLEVRPVPTSHAVGMLAVYMQNEQLLFAVDIFNPNINPPDQELPGEVGMWAKDLYAAIVDQGLDVAWLVGGHGFRLAPLEH